MPVGPRVTKEEFMNALGLSPQDEPYYRAMRVSISIHIHTTETTSQTTNKDKKKKKKKRTKQFTSTTS